MLKTLSLLVAILFLSGCATSALSLKEIEANPQSALLAISVSIQAGEAETLQLTDSSRSQTDLSLSKPTTQLAGEDVYLYELDPTKVYAVVKVSNGNFPTRLNRDLKEQFVVIPGGITYISSYMFSNSEAFYADVVPARASATSGTSEALVAAFPKRKIKFGYR